METDFNLTTDTCFDDEPENTNSLKELKKTAFLQRVEQEFNGNSLVKKKKIKVQFVFNASFPDGYQIKISPECKKDNPGQKKLSFGYRGSRELLLMVILEIDKEIKLFFDRTLVHVLVEMLTCDDLSKFNKKMHLACLTNEFRCLIDNLKPLCKSFNPTTVERCGLFVSNIGTPITASNLYNSSTDALPSRRKIEKIIRKLC